MRNKVKAYIYWSLASALVLLKLPIYGLPSETATVIWFCVAVIAVLYITIQSPWSLKLDWLLISFIACCAIEVAIVNPPTVFRSYARIAYFAISVLIFSTLVTSRRFDELRTIMWKVLCVALTIAAAISSVLLIIRISNAFIEGQIPIRFFHGVFERPMMLSLLCAIPFLIFSYIYACDVSTSRSVIVLVCACMSFCLILVGSSRMSAISAIAGLAVLTLWCRKRRLLYVWILIVGLGSVAMLTKSGGDILASSMHYKLGRAVEKNTMLWSREAFWTARWNEFEASPLLGIGFGAQSEFALPWDDYDKIMATGHIEPGSSYLGTLAQTGIIGFVLLLAYNIRLLYRFICHRVVSLRRQTGGRVCDSGKYIWEMLTDKPLLFSIYAALSIQAITEGYILAAGAVQFMPFWLLTSVINLKGGSVSVRKESTSCNS